jgi:hypothetical protein
MYNTLCIIALPNKGGRSFVCSFSVLFGKHICNETVVSMFNTKTTSSHACSRNKCFLILKWA